MTFQTAVKGGTRCDPIRNDTVNNELVLGISSETNTNVQTQLSTGQGKVRQKRQ